MRTAGLLALAVLVPSFAHAAVQINEIAWMGSAASSNAEWIELANTGSAPIDLSGWQLTSSSGAPNIALTGSVAANGFYLLERSSDDAVPGVTADQIYTGSLSNGGTVLTLLDAAGVVVDTVDGSDGWSSIGGDNTTKETAQRTSSGWVTAPPTPRAASSGSAAASAAVDAVASTTTAATSFTSVTYTPPPSGALKVSVQAGERVAYLHTPLHFSVAVRTKSGAEDAAVTVVWSFGDGSTGAGRAVEKTYHYPGTYVVEARAHDGSAEGEGDVTVQVVPARVRVSAVTGDGIIIANDTSERVDLSGWELFSGTGTFRMPPGTTLLPTSETLFPYAIINVPHSYDVRLTYPDRMIAAVYAPTPVATSTVVALAATSTKPAMVSTGSNKVQTVVKPAPSVSRVSAQTHDIEAVSAPAASTEVAAAGAAFAALPTSTAPKNSAPQASGSLLTSPWTFSFLGLAALAGGALLIL